MKSPSSYEILLATRIFIAEVVDRVEGANQLNLEVPAFGNMELEAVDVAYQCQECYANVDGKWAFAEQEGAFPNWERDEVLVEWTLEVPEDFEGATPTREVCRVIGHSDGFPRLCKPPAKICALVYQEYVVFYDCEHGCCYVPQPIEPSYIEQEWRGGGGGLDDYVYFKVNTAVISAVAFIELVFGCELEPVVWAVFEDSGAIDMQNGVANEYNIGPHDPDTTAGVSTGTLHSTACPEFDCCSITHSYTGNTFDCIRNYNVPAGSFYEINVKEYEAAVTCNGVPILPGGWITERGSATIREVNGLWSEYMLAYIVNYGDGGGSCTEISKCHTCPWPEYESDMSGKPHSQWGLVYGGITFVKAQRNWGVLGGRLLPNTGFGETGVSLPGWSGIASERSQVWSHETWAIKYANVHVIKKTNASCGWIIGNQVGHDWDLGGYYYPDDSQNWWHGPTDWNYSFDGYLHTWTIPGHKHCGVVYEGAGHQISREIYKNLSTGATREYVGDRVDRKIRGSWYQYADRSCVFYDGLGYGQLCFGPTYDPEDPTIIDQGSFLSEMHKYRADGYKLTIVGAMVINTLAVFELWELFDNGGGWHEDGVPPSETIDHLMTVQSAALADGADSTGEWAEGNVNVDDSAWVLAYFKKAYEASGGSGDAGLKTFVAGFGSTTVKAKFKEVPE